MNELEKELNNLSSTRDIKSIQFGLFSPNEIKTSSVCEVTKAETFDSSGPVINGLFDPRMGVIERGPECATCENNHTMCPGHFGHIELTLPVFHLHLLQEYVMKLLPCICFRCSSLLVNKENKKLLRELKGKKRKKRFKIIHNVSKRTQKNSLCCHNEGCRVIQPIKYTMLTSDKIRSIEKKIPGLEKDIVVAIIAEFNDEAIKDITLSKKHRITPEHCYEIFRKITDNDCKFLGFNPVFSRPEWMICTVLPVPPPSVRPSVQRDNNQRSEDDLTYVLLMIIKTNNQLRKRIENEEDQRKIDISYELLQWNVATLISNKIAGIVKNVQRSGKVIKSLTERIRGKSGRIRGNLLGKRVDQSARTVIGPDPLISIEEYGVPEKIAMINTFPDVVTKDNIEELLQIVRNGPNIHPGAKKIQRTEYDCFGNPSPCMINLKHVDPNSVKLKVGDIVHRHLKNGDISLFNRQPSLHRMSMMAHKIVIVKGNTFKLNVFVCKPYAADFDGDEMNTFLPQSLQTRIELQEIAGVSKQIISPAKSTPIIGVAQDSMVGSYLLTKTDFATSGEKLFQYIMPNIQLKSGINIFEERKKEKITGKELYSYILPNISLKNIKYDEKVYEKGVEIKNGNIIDGLMAKETLGGGFNGIIQAINNQFGSKICRNFLDNLQRLVVSWLEDIGFTVGFGDAIPKTDIKDNIKKIIEDKKKESDNLIRKAQFGLYEPYLNNDLKMKKLELEIKNIGYSTTQEVENIVMNNLSKDNNFMISIKSGSKGNAGNLNQIMGTVGQRLIGVERIPYGLTGRTTSHFTKYDIGLASRGYVYNSYMNGMTPQEFYMTTMNSRMDAINSKIKTAETGYMQRKLIKAMEDLKVEYDGTVRDACGNIVQVTYGEDGFDSVKLEHIPLRLINKSDKQMDDDYLIEVDDITKLFVTEETWTKIQKNKKDNNMILKEEWTYLFNERNNLRNKYFKNSLDKVSKYLSPVNFERMIHQVINQFHIKKYDLSNLTPIDVITMTDDLVDYINKYNVNCDYSPILKIMIKSHLSVKQCIYKYRLPINILKHIARLIKHKVLHAIVDPGEMIGVIAAQSIGEPLTQLVLGSYHRSGGLSNQSVATTSGIPRMQEIINIAKVIKTPSMTIYLKPEYSDNKEIAFDVKNQIEYTELKDLLLSSEILYLPEKGKGKFEEEEKEYKIYREIAELTEIQCPSKEDLSNWVLWMEFDREEMLRKNIYLNDIYEEIIRNCNVDTDIECVISNMNGNNLTLRIRVTKLLIEEDGYISFFKHISDNLMKLPLRGIEGINNVDVLSSNKNFYKPDGSVESKKEWYLKTFGSNLITILSNKYVDNVRTTTNDINEIYNLYGIEGARTAIIREIKSNIKDGAGANINNRHYYVLADLMTYRGHPMCISRHGFGESPFMSPLGRASYETMDKILISSGVFASEDNMKGTSSNIIAGQTVKAGTNSFDLYINKNLLPEAKNEINTLYPPEQNVNEMSETKFSPAFSPMDFPNNFNINDTFVKKMSESKKVKLEDYMKLINSQSSIVDDNNFDFGYNMNNFAKIKSNNINNINIHIVKN